MGKKSLYGAHAGPEWDKCPDSAHMGPIYTFAGLTFNLSRSSLLLYAFVWAPYICMEKMLIISKGFSSEASGPVLLKFNAEPLWAGE